MKTLCRGLILGVLGAILLASVAKAGTDSPILGTVDVKQTADKDNDTLLMNLYWTGVPEWSPRGWIGLYRFEYDNFNSPADGSQPAWVEQGSLVAAGFCIEAQRAATNESKTYEIRYLEDAPRPEGPNGQPMGEVKAEWVRALYGQFYDQGWEEAGSTDTVNKVAFHLALLEIVYEDIGNWNVTNRDEDGEVVEGNFRAAAYGKMSEDNYKDGKAAIDLANTWLAQLDGTGSRETNLVALSNDGFQDYIVRGQIVPEPSGLAMLAGLGGIGFVGAWRRRKRAA